VLERVHFLGDGAFEVHEIVLLELPQGAVHVELGTDSSARATREETAGRSRRGLEEALGLLVDPVDARLDDALHGVEPHRLAALAHCHPPSPREIWSVERSDRSTSSRNSGFPCASRGSRSAPPRGTARARGPSARAGRLALVERMEAEIDVTTFECRPTSLTRCREPCSCAGRRTQTRSARDSARASTSRGTSSSVVRPPSEGRPAPRRSVAPRRAPSGARRPPGMSAP
jgi:hypothetical protein